MVITIIFFQILIFAGLIFLLRHFMKGHVTGAVDHLQKLNEELSKQQTEAKQKMSEMQRDYETKMTKLNEEIQTKQKQVREEANKTLEDSRQRAMQEREKIISEAVQTREKIRQEIMADMEEKAILQAQIIIAELVTGDLAKQIHESLIQEAIGALREVDMQHFQIQTDTAELKTPFEIKETTKQEIAKILKEKIHKEIKFKEEIESTLVAGLILKFGTFVMDGSLMNRVAESSARLKKETKRKYQGAS